MLSIRKQTYVQYNITLTVFSLTQFFRTLLGEFYDLPSQKNVYLNYSCCKNLIAWRLSAGPLEDHGFRQAYWRALVYLTLLFPFHCTSNNCFFKEAHMLGARCALDGDGFVYNSCSCADEDRLIFTSGEGISWYENVIIITIIIKIILERFTRKPACKTDYY